MPRRITWKAHKVQTQVLQSDSRFLVLPAGRRAGKTECAMVWLLRQGQQLIDQGHDPEGINLYWGGPQWEHCSRGLEKVKNATKEDGSPNPLHAAYRDHTGSKGYMNLETKWGFDIQFTTTDNHERVEGAGIHALVLDECGFVKEDAWYNSLYPTLGMTMGRAFLTGRPKGRNWYYDAWVKAQDESEHDYFGVQAPSDCNPHLPAGYVERAKADLPDRVYRQEILAEFLEDSGAVFRGVKGLVTNYEGRTRERYPYRGPEAAEGWTLQEPQAGVEYVAGWDPAKHQDYSVLTVLRLPERHVVYHSRTQNYDYPTQVNNAASVCRRYNNAPIMLDAGGIGDPIYDYLCEEYRGGVEPYKFTATTKADLVNELAYCVDHGDVSFPDIPVLVNELQIFEMDSTPAGNVRYNAPEGKNDDCVDSLMLAVMKSKRRGPTLVDNDDLQEIFAPRGDNGGGGRGRSGPTQRRRGPSGGRRRRF